MEINLKSLQFFWISFIIGGFVSLSIGTSFEEDVTLLGNQKQLLDKFKKNVIPYLTNDYMKEDMHLIRWLRSRNFDLESAEEALLNDLKWRKENRMDTILREDWSEFENDYKIYFEGHDKMMKPLMYFEIATHDVRKAIITGKLEPYNRYISKSLEYAVKFVREIGEKYQNVTRGQIIINMAGYNLVEHGCIRCAPIYIRIVDLAENHYPGMHDKLILLNVPGAMEPMLNILRPFLGTDFSSRLKIYGTNRKEWKDALAKDFDWDELPKALGGNKVLSDWDSE